MLCGRLERSATIQISNQFETESTASIGIGSIGFGGILPSLFPSLFLTGARWKEKKSLL